MKRMSNYRAEQYWDVTFLFQYLFSALVIISKGKETANQGFAEVLKKYLNWSR